MPVLRSINQTSYPVMRPPTLKEKVLDSIDQFEGNMPPPLAQILQAVTPNLRDPMTGILGPLMTQFPNPEARQSALDNLMTMVDHMPPNTRLAIQRLARRYPRTMAHHGQISFEPEFVGTKTLGSSVPSLFPPRGASRGDGMSDILLHPSVEGMSEKGRLKTLAEELAHGAQRIRLREPRMSIRYQHQIDTVGYERAPLESGARKAASKVEARQRYPELSGSKLAHAGDREEQFYQAGPLGRIQALLGYLKDSLIGPSWTK